MIIVYIVDKVVPWFSMKVYFATFHTKMQNDDISECDVGKLDK